MAKRGRKPRNKTAAEKLVAFRLTNEEMSWLRHAILNWQDDKFYSTESEYAREILLERVRPGDNPSEELNN